MQGVWVWGLGVERRGPGLFSKGDQPGEWALPFREAGRVGGDVQSRFWKARCCRGRQALGPVAGARGVCLCQDLAVRVCLGALTEFVSVYLLFENRIFVSVYS